MKGKLASILAIVVLALALAATIAVAAQSSGGTTTQTTTVYDFPGLGCSNNKPNVRDNQCK